MQFDVGRDESGGELCVGSGTSASAPDLGGNVVQLLAVLFIAESVLKALFVWSEGLTLSATIGPLVALVSAAMTTPPS